MTDKKTFGSFIKEKRTEKNYSQKDLAELLFVTEGAVSKWERGVSYPDITLISDICRVLDISEHELLCASTDTDARKMKYEARKFRVIRDAWIRVPTISYAVARLVCFICNLAVNGTLSWFFVVLTALLCAYSFVPTFTPFFKEKKLLGFASTSFASICILLFTCAAYTKALFWFPTACIGVLMGYTSLFVPLLLAKTKLRQYSFIIVSVLEFALVLLLLLAVNSSSPFMLISAIKMTCFAFAPVFLCGIICLLRFDSLLKAGICTLICGVAYYFTGHIVNRLFNLSENYYQVNFNNWEQCISGNVLFIVLLSGLFVSVALIVIGAFRIKKR